MNKIKMLAGQTFVYGLGTIVPRLLNYLLLTPFYTRIFETGQYGIFTELYAYVAFFAVILTYGMETAFFRFAESHNTSKVYQTSLISLLATSALFIIPGLLLSGYFADALRYSDKSWYIQLFVLVIAIDAVLTIPFARLRNQNRAAWFSTVKIINLLLNIALNFYFLLICPHIYAANPDSVLVFFYSPTVGVGYAFIANLITTIVTAILLLPQMKISLRDFDFSLWKQMLKYAWPLLLVGIAGMINDVADKIFLKFLIDDPQEAIRQVGIYGANYKLAMFMTMFTSMFRFAADPFFFSQINDKNRNQIYADVSRYFVIAGLFIYLSIMLFIDIAKLFIGSDFHEGLKIVPIVMLANLFFGVTYNLSFWYKISGKTIYGAYISGIGAFITIAGNFFLIPFFGYMGAAVTTLVCYSVTMIVSWAWGQKHLPINYSIPRLGFYLFLSLILFFISSHLPEMTLTVKLLINLVLLSVFVLTVIKLEALLQPILSLYKRLVKH